MSFQRRPIREKTGVKKPTRSYSKKQENDIANALGGRVMPNSGATPYYKGDVLIKDFLLEAKTKTTDSASISIKKEWIDKNEKESLFMGKPYSALVINFGPSSKNYYIVSEEVFKTFVK